MSAATLLTFPVKWELTCCISVVAIRSTQSQFTFRFKIAVQFNMKLSVDTLNPNSLLYIKETFQLLTLLFCDCHVDILG